MMASAMEVDNPELFAYLSDFDIYTDEDFPLNVRHFIDPVLVDLKLTDLCLDLESTDPQVRTQVDDICDSAFEKIKKQENCASFQVKQFFRKFDDSRSFFTKLTEKLEIERSLTQKKNVAALYLNIKNKKREISKSIDEIMLRWQALSSQTEDFNSRLEDCSHNYSTIAKHNIVDTNTRVKVEQHRRDTSQQACQFQLSINTFTSSVNKYVCRFPQQVSDFVDVVHHSLRTLRTHFRKELPHFLVLAETCFTSLMEELEKVSPTIEQLIDKLKLVKLQLKIEPVSLHPLEDAIRVLVGGALVVSVEPSFALRCLKKERRNCYELRYLITKVGLKSTKVHAFLLNATSLGHFKECIYRGQTLSKEMIKDEHLGGTLKGDVAPLENDPVKRVVKCSFKDLTITRASRKHKQNEAVTEQKHVILFIGEVLIDNEPMPVHCFSLPVIVVVHGSQITKSLAAIFWDDNFPVDKRSTFEMKSYVKWTAMDTAIRGLFRRELSREPTKSNMEYLRRRLYADHAQNQDVSFDMFARQSTNQKHKHTFWEWIWGTIQLLSGDEHLLKLWQSGYIVGYIQQNDAKDILIQHRERADLPIGNKDSQRLFLIRFSESQKELITVQGHLHDPRKGWGVFSVDPYKAQDLKSISLSQRILDRADCQTLLFEEMVEANGEIIERWTKQKKENIFTPTANYDDTTYLGDGYISWTLKERTDTARFEGASDSFRIEMPLPDDPDALSPNSVPEDVNGHENLDMNRVLGDDWNVFANMQMNNPPFDGLDGLAQLHDPNMPTMDLAMDNSLPMDPNPFGHGYNL